MTVRRERLLDSLLAALVIVSLVLSSRVWADPTRYSPVPSDRARVQPQPYVPEWTMPDIFRPEQVTVLLPDGRGAYGGPDSALYAQVWREVKPILHSLRPLGSPRPIAAEEVELWRDGSVITLILPVALSFAELSERWGWNIFALRTEGDLKIDRVYLYTGDPGGIIFGGPTGQWRMIYLTEPDLTRLPELIESIEPPFLHSFTPLPADKVQYERLAPDPQFARLVELTVTHPNREAVLSRFFADLSVVREIEEKRHNGEEVDLNATSYTDGQKLVRIYYYGAIEYYAPDRTTGSTPPSFSQALQMAQDFVTAHGGWPQEVVLTGWEAIGNRVVLTFDYRKGVSGIPPVVSRHGYLKVGVTQDKVVYLFREPVLRLLPEGVGRRLISLQEALRILSDEKPWTRFEKVREAYVAYVFQSGHQRQLAEPYWVINLTWGQPYYVNALAQPNREGSRILSEVPSGP